MSHRWRSIPSHQNVHDLGKMTMQLVRVRRYVRIAQVLWLQPCRPARRAFGEGARHFAHNLRVDLRGHCWMNPAQRCPVDGSAPLGVCETSPRRLPLSPELAVAASVPSRLSAACPAQVEPSPSSPQRHHPHCLDVCRGTRDFDATTGTSGRPAIVGTTLWSPRPHPSCPGRPERKPAGSISAT